MSLVKLALNMEPIVNAAKGTGIKDALARFSNGHLITKMKNPTFVDKAKHLLTTKEGLKAIAPTAALYGGGALAIGAGAKLLSTPKEK